MGVDEGEYIMIGVIECVGLSIVYDAIIEIGVTVV